MPTDNMPMFCVVYGCSNRSNREKEKGVYRVPKIVVHKGEKCKKLTEQRRQKWIFNLRLQSGGAESVYSRDTTYLCECGFSTLLQLKPKQRNRLDTEHDLRVALSTVLPDFETLIKNKPHAQLSH